MRPLCNFPLAWLISAENSGQGQCVRSERVGEEPKGGPFLGPLSSISTGPISGSLLQLHVYRAGRSLESQACMRDEKFQDYYYQSAINFALSYSFNLFLFPLKLFLV